MSKNPLPDDYEEPLDDGDDLDEPEELGDPSYDEDEPDETLTPSDSDYYADRAQARWEQWRGF